MASIWRLSALCGAQGGRGEVSRQPEVLSAPPSGEGDVVRLPLLGGETAGAGNASFPLAALAPSEATAVTTVSFGPSCLQERAYLPRSGPTG